MPLTTPLGFAVDVLLDDDSLENESVFQIVDTFKSQIGGFHELSQGALPIQCGP